MPKTAAKKESSTGTTYFQVPLSKHPTKSASTAEAESNASISKVFQKDASGLTAYQRHKKMMGDYLSFYGTEVADVLEKRRSSSYIVGKTELDILKEQHRFLRNEEDDADNSWESRVAKKYYDRLFKEYCLANLSRYKTGQIALRWRTQKEVVSGQGQFVCGNLECSATEDLRSWEVNFAYVEGGERKNALVKVRLCPTCSYKLNYKKIKTAEKAEKEDKKRKRKEKRLERKRRKSGDEDQSSRPPGEDDKDVDKDVSDGETDREEHSPNEESKDESSVSKELKDQYSKDEVSRIWSAPQPEALEGESKEDEIEAYFADLFQ
ncbi:hypothetical protein SpCBS45565_g01444 [Spizellomyces sp. 'palustris']|nr:hypothetical protein SpCBS45565_g01444 [Spizellomyces sp. 'palustris']